MRALAHGGRWVVIGTQGGIKGPINFLRMAAKQAVLTGNLLRPRSAAEKARFWAGWWNISGRSLLAVLLIR